VPAFAPKTFSRRWTKSSMNRVEAVHEAMVALQTPPPLARWNVWLCVLLAVVLVAALMASQNGGIAAVFGRIRQGKSFPGS
jgi:hypothetical protein